jgi:hypothetical protein
MVNVDLQMLKDDRTEVGAYQRYRLRGFRPTINPSWANILNTLEVVLEAPLLLKQYLQRSRILGDGFMIYIWD